MSNYTVVRLTKVQPYMHTVGSSYAALANVDGFYGPTLEAGLLDFHGNTSHATHANLTGDSVLVLIGEDTYSYRSTSTIVLMVTAWILLILGFVFCCCAECCGVSVWRGKKRASVNDVNRMEAGAADGDGGGGGGGRGTAAETNAAPHQLVALLS
ncbi:uncharacterized protein Dana_GF10386 [Drosophila ananassae]|uniref:Uncharacterized protein n=1 Tax=Drosophila ananassae TaxID=7217 RepID=B3MAC1_DROAN|nr:uncharacterized protein Dana_GF10386 [Drosophila ananassae]